VSTARRSLLTACGPTARSSRPIFPLAASTFAKKVKSDYVLRSESRVSLITFANRTRRLPTRPLSSPRSGKIHLIHFIPNSIKNRPNSSYDFPQKRIMDSTIEENPQRGGFSSAAFALLSRRQTAKRRKPFAACTLRLTAEFQRSYCDGVAQMASPEDFASKILWGEGGGVRNRNCAPPGTQPKMTIQ
jgi:hypothetical protein